MRSAAAAGRPCNDRSLVDPAAENPGRPRSPKTSTAQQSPRPPRASWLSYVSQLRAAPLWRRLILGPRAIRSAMSRKQVDQNRQDEKDQHWGQQDAADDNQGQRLLHLRTDAIRQRRRQPADANGDAGP